MNKTFRMMGLCALIALAAAGCKKNEQKDTMNFKATISQPAVDAKTHIGDSNYLVWNSGDQIKVYTADKTEAASATFATTDADQTTANFSGTLAESDLYYAFYPTTGVELNADGKFMLPVSATQTFVESNFATNTYPMCATSTDGNFTFGSPYGILGIPLKGDATIGSIVLTDSLGMQLEGYYQMNETDTTFVGTGDAVTVAFGSEGYVLDTVATTVYFVVPAGAFASGFKAEVKGTDGSTITVLETNKNNVIHAETIRLMQPAVTVNDGSTFPEGAIPGLFSVCPNKQVYFAQGNLQYKAEGSYLDADNNLVGGTWRFAEHQWDVVGGFDAYNSIPDRGNVYEGGEKCKNNNVASDYDGWIDLFGWGTSGWNSGADRYLPYALCEYPNYEYYRPGGSSNTSASLTGDYAEADWAWHNPIANGGNQAHLWHTITYDEINYLLHGRAGCTQKSGYGTVNGVPGTIILPDDFNDPCTNHGDQAFSSSQSNEYSLGGNWEAMEARGAVFFPAAGTRTYSPQGGLRVQDVFDDGTYWTSTRKNTYDAYSLLVNINGSASCDAGTMTCVGCSVRAVIDAQ